MKAYISSLLIFTSMVAVAKPQQSTVELPTAGEITSVEPLCPKGMMCITNGSTIRMTFRFSNGCSALKPLQFEVNATLNAVEVEAIESRELLGVCTMAIVERDEAVSVPGVYPPFVLSFKGTGVSLEVPNFF